MFGLLKRPPVFSYFPLQADNKAMFYMLPLDRRLLAHMMRELSEESITDMCKKTGWEA
jgi:hypothetical protein